MRALTTAVATSVLVAAVPASASAAGGNPFPGPVGGARLGTSQQVQADGAVPPVVPAAAWLIADLDTGDVLAAKAAHTRLRPASTLKTLTALVLLPRLDKTDRLMGRYQDAAIEGSKVGVHPGLMYSVELLFQGMFLASGNDAVHALASHDQGGLPATVQRMNAKAAELGAFDTRVVDPTGLDADWQLTSAYDLALIARAGMRRTDFRRYAATRMVHYPRAPKPPEPPTPEPPVTGPIEPVGSYQVGNQNRLIWNYPGALGIKTGYTSLAKNTFVGAAQRGGRRLVVTLLLSPHGVTKHAATLLDWAFANRARLRPVGSLVTPAQVAAASRQRGGTAVKSGAGHGSGTEEVVPPAAGPPQRAGGARSILATIPMWAFPLPLLLLPLLWFRPRARARRTRR